MSTQEDGRRLIVEAFTRARRSGKVDWQVMTSAVLKNRLLQITDHAFDTESYGARTLRDFLQAYSDMLDIRDRPNGLTEVRLAADVAPGFNEPENLSPEPAVKPQGLSREWTVRSDLWRAVLDWRSASPYILDPVTQHARPPRSGDPIDLAHLPQLSQEEYASIRLRYIDELLELPLGDEDRVKIEEWRDNEGPSRFLPAKIRDGWMSHLRQEVVTILRRWYAQAGIDLPEDLIHSSSGNPRRAGDAAGVSGAVGLARLRDAIQRCVGAMTYEELCQLDLPATVVARVFSR